MRAPYRPWGTRIAALLGAFLILAGCGGMEPEDFAGREPKLVLEDYFHGRTKAWGLFEDRFGTVRRQFIVDIDGTWDGETLTLDERFRYDDGERQRRVWQIVKTGDHGYKGKADDIIGVARGTAYGNALNWTYTMDLKVDETDEGEPVTWRVAFDDWMFLAEDGVLINRATITRFGIEIGRVTLFFQRVETAG